MTHKVPISFSAAESELAARLHHALSTHGAEVFQFEQTTAPGTTAWTAVLDAIKAGLFFIHDHRRNIDLPSKCVDESAGLKRQSLPTGHRSSGVG